MYRYLLLIPLVFTTFNLSAQDKLVFSYDPAGNQTRRDRVCISCGARPAPAEEAPLALEAAVEDPSSIGRELTAYPNPTSGMVNLQWNNTATATYTHFEVYALDGRLVISKRAPASGSNMQLDFSGLPSGTYLLQALDAKGNFKLFKILKH